MKTGIKIPMYITVQLENGDKRVWLPLPATITQFQTSVEKIDGQDGNFTIRDYAMKVPKLSKADLMGVSLALVNFLAARLMKLNDYEILKLCAISDSEYYFCDIENYIDYTFQPGKYKLLQGVTDEEKLGDYYIRRPGLFFGGAKQKRCIDRREYGQRLAETEKGAFTPHGYITSRIGWNLLPKQRHIPDSLNIKGCIGENLYGDWEAESASYK